MIPVTWLLAIALTAAVVAEASFAGHHAPVFPWHEWPGFSGALGLVSCVVVVLLSKALGRAFLQRPEAGEPPEDGP